MITEQGEMIDRLDDNLDAAEVNVNMVRMCKYLIY